MVHHMNKFITSTCFTMKYQFKICSHLYDRNYEHNIVKVQYVQGKDSYMCALFMQGNVSCKCTCVHLLCTLMLSIFHAHAGFVASDFRNLSSCVVVTCLLTQMHTTNPHETKKIHATFYTLLV